MTEPFIELYRFNCPHCQRVLKAPLAWAGRKGVCPRCQKPVVFPEGKSVAGSKLAVEIQRLLGDAEGPLDEAALDKLATVLAQGTCRDYRMASDMLGPVRLSPRQWRRVLRAGATREALRQHIESHLANPPAEEADTMMAVTEAPPGESGWQILARYIYLLRHGPCEGCGKDPTGLHCIYLSWETFLRTREIPADRAARWEKVCQSLLGL